MLKISESLERIILNSPFFTFGMKKNILNFSKLADLVHPMVEQQVKKEVSKQSLVMQFSRMQKTISEKNPKSIGFLVQNISIISGLSTISFSKINEIQKNIPFIKNQIENKGGFFCLNETTSEITIIYDTRFSELFFKYDESKIYQQKQISGIKLNFSQEDFDTPGLLSFLLDKFSLSGINIVELSSSFTEVIFYIDKKDTRKAFDILYI